MWERYEAITPGFGSEPSSGHLMAEHIVASAAERVARTDPTLHVTTALVPSEPVAALLREGEAAFAIVVGTRGRGPIAGMVLGSTSLEVAARATCPVVVVRDASAQTRGEFGRVTLGVGTGGESSAAVEFALREARARETELHAVHAWHRPARELPGTRHLSGDGSDREAHDAEHRVGDALLTAAQEFPKVTVHREAVEGPAHDVLLSAAETSDLLVVGARRRHGSVGLQLGPVNHAVLHHSACSVAVVPQE
jgi:nucleotide-binding universal stress UspA family protein